MKDFPTQVAAWLEGIATRARSLTVDKANKVIRYTTLGIVAAAFALMALIFLSLTIYQSLEIAVGDWGAYAILAGVFTVAGAFIWMKRSKE